ncbi:MAG: acyl-CoA thioesterase [Pseudomonadales bacterium]|nr:acyl-CoA thioesterase [Pseudomonadales bacterium]
MSEEKTLVDTTEIDTRWGDQDKYGHINNTVYFRFVEEARVQWFEKLGYGVDGSGDGPIILKTGATFLKELNYPTRIQVKSYAGTPGNSSLPMYHEIIDSEDGSVYCTAYVTVVWYDHNSKSSMRLPDSLREHIAQLSKNPSA